MKEGVEARGCPGCSSHLPSPSLGEALDLGPDLTGLWIQCRDLLHLHLGAQNTCEEEVKIVGCGDATKGKKGEKQQSLNFPDRESNPDRGGESAESYPLDHQGRAYNRFVSDSRKPTMSVCYLPPSCSECRTSLQGTVPEERSLPAFSKRGAPHERPNALRDSGRAREARRGRKSRASCPVWAAPQNCPGAAPLPGDRVWRAGRRGRDCRDRRGGARGETSGSPTP